MSVSEKYPFKDITPAEFQPNGNTSLLNHGLPVVKKMQENRLPVLVLFALSAVVTQCSAIQGKNYNREQVPKKSCLQWCSVAQQSRTITSRNVRCQEKNIHV